MITRVELGRGEGVRFYIIDPPFSGVYRLPSGELADLTQALQKSNAPDFVERNITHDIFFMKQGFLISEKDQSCNWGSVILANVKRKS